MHLTTCRKAKPFWDRVFTFTRTVLGCPDPSSRQQAIVLNRWTRKELGPEDARALIRHAFGRFYRDFSMVDTHDKPLIIEYTWLNTRDSKARSSDTPKR